MLEIQNIGYKYADIFMQMLKARYKELGLEASGEFEEQMRSVVTEKSMIILGADHSMQMEKGRLPGTMPPIKSIRKWMDVKRGLSVPSEEKAKQQMAWAIAIKIKKEGIKVPNRYNRGGIISDTIEDFMEKHLPSLVDEIFSFTRVDVNSQIINNLMI